MYRLRSRWTVVALVPVFFLTGFALVSALADGSDDAAPAAAGGSTPDAAAGVVTVTVVAPGSEETPTEDAAETATDAGSETAPAQASGGGGRGGGNAPQAPPSGTITIDYGRWKDMFAIENAEMIPEFGAVTVAGEFKYLGGSDCPVGNVVVRGWFFSEQQELLGTGVWESVSWTGAGAEVLQREPLYLQLHGTTPGAVDSAALRFTRLDCL